tara:strand:+ start:144 stop:593 length:450 start_codon:yes stop_codon:yes gene_type:complete
MKKSVFFLSTIILLLNQFIFSQKFDEQKWVVDFPENVNTELTSEENNMIEEAFGIDLKNKILSNHSRLMDIKDILRNRVELFDAKEKNISSIMTLSKVPLYDFRLLPKSFDPNNFNPLLYNFNFYSKETLVYRVENTSYLIFIQPRKLK